MIGVTTVFSSCERVGDDIYPRNTSHVTLSKAHHYLFKIPGLGTVIDWVPGEELLLYLNSGKQHQLSQGCVELLNNKKQSESKIEPVTEKQSSLSAIVKRTKRTKRISLKPKENRFLSHKLRVPGTQSKTKTQSKRQSRLMNRSSYNCGQLYLNPINQLLKQ